MIPGNITKDHILRALAQIQAAGVPPGRGSRKYHLVHEGRAYPPKYVIALANAYANGAQLASEGFSGGTETNSYLTALGFAVSQAGVGGSTSRHLPPKARDKRLSVAMHSAHCKACKNRVGELLERLYGNVLRNHAFQVGSHPDQYASYACAESLRGVFNALVRYRGHQQLTSVAQLPRVDFFLPEHARVVEFDEKQHFTEARRIALMNYPPTFPLGFSSQRWQRLCTEIHARDDTPPHRDEQRAWYDTLRDFLSQVCGLKPTVRLYAGDLKWCSLTNAEGDIAKFQAMIGIDASKAGSQVRPILARVVVVGPWAGEVDEARRVLRQVCNEWPQELNADCLTTCGGFILFPWPKSLVKLRDARFPPSSVLGELTAVGQAYCDRLLANGLRERLAQYTRCLTIGVDSHASTPLISLSSTAIRHAHVELVALVDLKAGTYHWTGKSYPTSNQESGLVRFADPTSHFVEAPFGRSLILGCHDLNVFSPRGEATTKAKWRHQAREEFMQAARRFGPTSVLHHPHTTDSQLTWIAGWSRLRAVLPTVESYAGSGRYCATGSGRQRTSLDRVLSSTASRNCVTFVVEGERVRVFGAR